MKTNASLYCIFLEKLTEVQLKFIVKIAAF